MKASSRLQQELCGAWKLAFDGRPSALVQVPGIWNLVYPTQEGAGTYTTSFDIPADWQGKAVYLHFEGASYFTQVWVNGHYMGSHEGAYTPFNFDVTEWIRPTAPNQLEVRVVCLSKEHPVEGMALHESPASKQSWYYTFGGLWGRIYLEAVAQVYFRQLKVTPDLRNQCIQVDVTLHNHLTESRPCTLRLEVAAPDGRLAASQSCQITALPGTAIYAFTLPIRQSLPWSCQSPNLYRLEASLASDSGESDTQVIRFGLRDFTVRDGQFFLNGEPLFIRGILMQPDYPLTLVVPPDKQMLENDLRLAKEAGFNLLRVHIRPAAPGLLDLADEMGLLIYAETSLAWIKDSPRLKDHGRQAVSELVEHGYNHPSVVFWGIYNENPGASAINGAELASYARSLDPTRVIVEDSGGSLALDQDFGWIDRAAFIPERQAQAEEAIDIHLYLGGILPQPVYNWLSSLGSGSPSSSCLVNLRLGSQPVLDEFDRRLRQQRGKLFLSELGCGGLTDLDAAVAGYGEHTDVQDALDLRRLRDELHQGFASRGLDKIFGSVKRLVQQAQALQAEGVSRQIEAVLVNPRFSGFGVTQMRDLAWECHAGILDVWGHPKPVYAALSRLNRAHCLVIDRPIRVAAAGTNLAIGLTQVSQAETDAGVQMLCWLENERQEVLESYHQPAVSQAGIYPYGEVSFHFELPGRYLIYSRLETESDILAETTAAVLVLQADDPQDRLTKTRWIGLPPVISGRDDPPAVGQDQPSLLLAAHPASLTRAGWSEMLDAVWRGNTAILGALTPEDRLAVEMLSGVGVDIKLSPGIGSWNGFYHWIPANRPFAGLPSGCLAGEEYVDILPHYVLGEIEGEILAGSFTTTTSRRQEKHILWYDDIVSIQAGSGKIVFCQYRIFNQPPGHPTAMQLTSGLLDMFIVEGR